MIGEKLRLKEKKNHLRDEKLILNDFFSLKISFRLTQYAILILCK